MQLPRGTFQGIRKKVIIRDLLSDLEKTRFTGTFGIISGPATGSFVFREGNCILARYHGDAGDAGWEAMLQSAGEAVDVILSTLDETQIKLSLEFNPGCIIHHKVTPALGHGPVLDPAPAGKKATAHTSPEKGPAKPSGRRAVITAEIPLPVQKGEPVHKRGAPFVTVHPKDESIAVSGTPPAEDPDDFESDIDALDSMDLDLVTSRIRSDCKNLVRQLQLDHLIER